jgi:FixJ family two-component response regulator
MDVGLPGMSGLELLELLRTRAYSKPVILIAASCGAHIQPRMRKAGASALLMKPVAPDVLLSALHRATDGRTGPAFYT